MTRFYALPEANERLSELEPLLTTLASQRVQLIRLRDTVLGAEEGALPVMDGSGRQGAVTEHAVSSPDELRLARLRMQGLIDQMQAGVARIDELDVALRDIETGLVDFPALVHGRRVWLCWRLGEPDVAWWHELDAGIAGRRPITDLG